MAYWSQAIGSRASELFHDTFNSKLFRQQLVYFEDIDYSEAVSYVLVDPGEKVIREFLTETAIEALKIN